MKRFLTILLISGCALMGAETKPATPVTKEVKTPEINPETKFRLVQLNFHLHLLQDELNKTNGELSEENNKAIKDCGGHLFNQDASGDIRCVIPPPEPAKTPITPKK